MKELTLKYIPGTDESKPRVGVSYRPEIGAQPQERETEFDFSFEDAYRRQIQWYLEEYLLFPWGEFLTRARQTEDLMKHTGEEMFNAAFGSRETYRLYTNVDDVLGETRIVIQASDPEGISLPWELLRDPELGEYGDLARLARTFVRSQSDLMFEPSPAPAGDEFNILMVISRPGGPEGDVPFQTVARPMLELFREHRDRIHLDVLRPPTFEQLARVLSEKPNHYHVLHFDGHGTFPQASDGSRFYAQPGQQGLLVFEGEGDKPFREVSGEELGGIIAGKGLPVVLLNACQSGMTHPESLYPSVGNELLKAGCRGVVAMAYSVYVQTAVRFMARLYQGLINGEELGRAVALGREELRSHPQRMSPIGEIDLNDWVVPVLFQSAPVHAIQGLTEVKLDLNSLQDQQTKAGEEIDCPEPPLFGFVGRDGVVLDLERAFQKETIVLIQGMAGVGKTEMAIGFARWLAETSALDGPIFFFRFEQYLPMAQVYDRVGGVFNELIKQQIGKDWHLLGPNRRKKVALSILKQVSCLMIWDNFEPVSGFPKGSSSDWKPEEQIELRDFLHDLGGGKTKVLLTSRRDEKWLGNIYRRVELGGLNLLEAQELSLRVMRRARLKPEEIKALTQYNDLLQYLNGSPLAIQVILPELKRTTPEKLLTALKTGEAEFGEEDPLLGRERSLAASLTYRLDALDPTLHQQLGLLALFQGFVDADVLAMICGVEGVPKLFAGLERDEWIDRLDNAAEVGFLRQVGEGYYTVHPVLPWFFHDLLRETFSDQMAWFERAFSVVYSRYGIYMHKQFEFNPEITMSLLSAEKNNMMFVLSLARKNQSWEEVKGILNGLHRLLITQGRWVEWERLILEIEEEVTNSVGLPLPRHEELGVALLGHRAEIAVFKRDFKMAGAIHLSLKEHYESKKDEKNMAVAMHQLGNISMKQRKFDEAEGWYNQSLETRGQIEDLHGQAVTLHQLGMLAQLRSQFDEAEHLYRQSLEIDIRIGDLHGQALTLHQMGIIAQERRHFDDAESWYHQSLEIELHIGDERGQAGTLLQLGIIARDRRQIDEAENWYRQSLEITERIGDEHMQAGALHQLGGIAIERRQLDEAERWYRQSLEISERVRDEQWQGNTLHQLGRVAQERQQFDEAESLYRQGLEIKERIGDKHGQANTLHQLGRVAQEQQQFDEAENCYHKSLEIKESIGDVHGLASTLHQLGMIAEEQGNIEEAIGLYKQSESMFIRLNDSYGLNIERASLSRLQGKKFNQD